MRVCRAPARTGSQSWLVMLGAVGTLTEKQGVLMGGQDLASVANSSTNPTEASRLNWLIQTRQNWLIERLIDKLIVHGGHVTIWPLQHEP
jgi:hypothetical protein